MSVDPVSIRKALSARIGAAGLREAKGPLGLEMEPGTVIDRSFEVVFTEDSDAGERVRAGVRIWLVQQFVVRLAHRLPLKGGAESRDKAIEDASAVRRALLVNASDALETCQNTITYGGGSAETRGQGAYLLTTQRWALRYDASLEA